MGAAVVPGRVGGAAGRGPTGFGRVSDPRAAVTGDGADSGARVIGDSSTGTVAVGGGMIARTRGASALAGARMAFWMGAFAPFRSATISARSSSFSRLRLVS